MLGPTRSWQNTSMRDDGRAKKTQGKADGRRLQKEKQPTTVLWRRHSTRRRTRENNGLASGAQEANGTYQIFLPGKLLVIFSAEIDLFHAIWATDAKDSEKTVKCGLSKTKLTRKPVVSEKQVTHVGEVAAKAAFAFKQKSPLDAHNRYREQPVFYIPQPSSDDESCRLERIATNSIHSKQRLNTMQIDMHRQKQNTKERRKKNSSGKAWWSAQVVHH